MAGSLFRRRGADPRAGVEWLAQQWVAHEDALPGEASRQLGQTTWERLQIMDATEILEAPLRELETKVNAEGRNSFPSAAFGLSKEGLPEELSGGQMLRVPIALALVIETVR